MRRYLAIDAGGSGVRSLVWDYPDGRWQPSFTDTPASLSSVSASAVYRALAREALTVLGGGRPADVAAVGVAGCVSATDRAQVAEHLQQAGVAHRVVTHHDAYMAWMGATAPRLRGILVIAGTGSSIFLKDSTGQEILVGGYGWRLGDDGSGSDLGRALLRAAAAEEDGYGLPSTLRARVLAALEIDSMRQAMVMVRGRSADWLAGLAPVLLEAVADGDALAIHIVNHRLDRLVRQIGAAMRRVAVSAPQSVDLFGTGGLFSSPVYRDAIDRALERGLEPGTHLRPPAHCSLEGAMLTALALDGVDLSTALKRWPEGVEP